MRGNRQGVQCLRRYSPSQSCSSRCLGVFPIETPASLRGSLRPDGHKSAEKRRRLQFAYGTLNNWRPARPRPSLGIRPQLHVLLHQPTPAPKAAAEKPSELHRSRALSKCSDGYRRRSHHGMKRQPLTSYQVVGRQGMVVQTSSAFGTTHEIHAWKIREFFRP